MMMRFVLLLALFAFGCGGPCMRGMDRPCCYSCVEWPDGKWYTDARWESHGLLGISGAYVGTAVRGTHHADRCECSRKCPCWTGRFRGVDEPGMQERPPEERRSE